MPKGMYQIARIEFQKCIFLVLQGGTSTLRHLPVHASAERGAGSPLWSLPLHTEKPTRVIWLIWAIVGHYTDKKIHLLHNFESFCPCTDPLWLKWVKWLIWAALPPPSRGKAVLDLPLFVIYTIHVRSN